MKTSLITTCSPSAPHRNDPWKEAIRCYLDFADEVVVVVGDKPGMNLIAREFNDKKLKLIHQDWPYKWNWSQLPKALNEGLDNATGDAIIRTDIDYFIHHADNEWFKIYLEAFIKSGAYTARTIKFNVVNRYFGMIKSRIPNIINGKLKDKIRFGKAANKRTDWTEPLLNIGGCRKPRFETITDANTPMFRVRMYNYDYFFSKEEDVKEEFWRFAQAYSTKDDLDEKDKYSWGKDKEQAWGYWKQMMEGRIRRSSEKILIHPKHIQAKIDSMEKGMFGYDNFELINYING